MQSNALSDFVVGLFVVAGLAAIQTAAAIGDTTAVALAAGRGLWRSNNRESCSAT